MKRIIISILGIIIIFLVGVLGIYNYFYIHKLDVQKRIEKSNKEFIINRGDSLESILQRLGLNNKISKLYLKVKKIDNKIKAGSYTFQGSYTRNEIFEKLIQGEYKTIKFTIPEGFTLKQIKSKLVREDLINLKKFNKILQTKDDFSYYVIDNNYEGYFFPDTYFFREGISEKDIINKILNNFDKNIRGLNILDEISKKELYDILKIASIIEKEAYYDYEKPIISSVFNNRLNQGMKLESCATIEYLFDYQKKRILYEDLKIESDYNTYIYKGLPPTPISNPGIEAIKSALYPQNTEYFYFRAKENREHFFSKTYREHLNFSGEERGE
ncbi:MAG: endolytic transglycosylase MltG [Fusobacteriota bacterium]